MLGLKSQLCHLLAIIFWASQLSCLDISFLICKMRMIVPPITGFIDLREKFVMSLIYAFIGCFLHVLLLDIEPGILAY